MSNKHGVLVPKAQNAMDKFKLETSNQLGIKIPHATKEGYWGYVPAERCGEVGGTMVKKMVESFERKLIK